MQKFCNLTELAEIIGVTKSAICQAVSSGRLSKSIVKKQARTRRFEIYRACIEWENSRDNSQVRDPSSVTEPAGAMNNEYPTIAESRQIKEYYEALNERVQLLKDTESLVDLSEVEGEVFALARQLRDRLQEIPEKMRFPMLSAGLDDAGAGPLITWLEGAIHDVLLEVSEMDFSALAQKPRHWDLDEGVS